MNNSNNEIRNEIQKLAAGGVPLNDILVNDGLSEWGDTCATTRDAALELIEEWGTGDINDLALATDWLDDH